MVTKIAQKIKAYITKNQSPKDAERFCCHYNKHIPNAKTARSLDKALKDIEQGKNLSPGFTNAKDAIAWLKSNKIL